MASRLLVALDEKRCSMPLPLLRTKTPNQPVQQAAEKYNSARGFKSGVVTFLPIGDEAAALWLNAMQRSVGANTWVY